MRRNPIQLSSTASSSFLRLARQPSCRKPIDVGSRGNYLLGITVQAPYDMVFGNSTKDQKKQQCGHCFVLHHFQEADLPGCVSSSIVIPAGLDESRVGDNRRASHQIVVLWIARSSAVNQRCRAVWKPACSRATIRHG